MDESTERTFWEYLAYISENYSPIDFVLIADHIDKFFYGTLVTLEITFLSLLIGGVLSIPLAIARAYKRPFLNGPSDKVIIYFRYNFSRILRWKLKFLIEI